VIWLLDTNIFIPALNGRPGIRTRINEAAASGEVVTSVLVFGELLHGAQCSKRRADNIRAVETELSRNPHLAGQQKDLSAFRRPQDDTPPNSDVRHMQHLLSAKSCRCYLPTWRPDSVYRRKL
jgi:predicted nucleic acid-binding protein